VITAGIDLASQPARTAACRIAWEHGKAAVVELQRDGVDDDLIAMMIAGADRTGIDVPLGWPDGFIAAVSAHHAAREWAGGELAQLRMRTTDEWVHRRTGRWPLSVSTDRIGVPALRAARVLARIPAAADRSGAGPVVEVYPAAALHIWGLQSRRYKRVAGTSARRALVMAFRERTEAWLELSDEAWSTCERSDDALDAIVAALVARAAACGLVDTCPRELQSSAAREGWIMLPLDNSLHRLAQPADTME
jgi:predicted nuclease with RNAse H fold